MIHVPKGKPVFTGMDGYVLSFDKVVERQKNAGFSGFLTVTGRSGEGVLPLAAGEALSGTFSEGTHTYRGDEAQSRMRATLASEGATADLYACEGETVVLYARYDVGQRLFAEIEALLVDPGKLFTLLSDKQLTGYLRSYEVRSRHRLGMQLLRAGKIRESQLAEAVRRQLLGEEGHPLLGHILVAIGAATQEDVNACLSEQVTERPGPDTELGSILFVRGEHHGPLSEAKKLVETPGALLDIYSLVPIPEPH